jgi:ribokinase
VVETAGAGDGFTGGFAAALARGESPLDAVRFGCALASLSVTRPGTAPSMPTLAEIEAVLLGEPVKSGSVSAHQS